MRVPLRDWHNLGERPGHLALYGSPIDINVAHSPSLLLQKQVRHDLHWSIEIECAPAKDEEAGTVVWLHEASYAALGLRGRADGNLDVVLRAPDSPGGMVGVSYTEGC